MLALLRPKLEGRLEIEQGSKPGLHHDCGGGTGFLSAMVFRRVDTLSMERRSDGSDLLRRGPSIATAQ
jgi:hypothetical protein